MINRDQFSDAIKYKEVHFGKGSRPVHIGAAKCNGSAIVLPDVHKLGQRPTRVVNTRFNGINRLKKYTIVLLYRPFQSLAIFMGLLYM